MEVFLLWHVYEREEASGLRDEEKLIGVFSTEERARETIDRLKGREGFRDFPVSCFEIHKMQVDRAGWTDGFSTVRWRE